MPPRRSWRRASAGRRPAATRRTTTRWRTITTRARSSSRSSRSRTSPKTRRSGSSPTSSCETRSAPTRPARMSQGNKAIAKHTISKAQCLAGLKDIVIQTPEQRAKCGADNMVPVWIKGKEPWFCIDVFEFPNKAVRAAVRVDAADLREEGLRAPGQAALRADRVEHRVSRRPERRRRSALRVRQQGRHRDLPHEPAPPNARATRTTRRSRSRRARPTPSRRARSRSAAHASASSISTATSPRS